MPVRRRRWHAAHSLPCTRALRLVPQARTPAARPRLQSCSWRRSADASPLWTRSQLRCATRWPSWLPGVLSAAACRRTPRSGCAGSVPQERARACAWGQRGRCRSARSFAVCLYVVCCGLRLISCEPLLCRDACTMSWGAGGGAAFHSCWCQPPPPLLGGPRAALCTACPSSLRRALAGEWGWWG